ncbi:MAG: ribose transport system ATP-binding protein [Woeseiaceae bacterium]|jgi:ribose transport system ATP-binding protein
MENARLSIENLHKSFSVPVLKGINLSIAPGEIHAIVGENGAGKSTLVNILAGLLQREAGTVSLDGENYEPDGPADAFLSGVSFAAQELSTIGTLSVAENVALRNLPQKNFTIAREELRKRANRLLQMVGLGEIDPNMRADLLSLADRQLLELAKALSQDCRLLILDEPTAALTAPQAVRLHEIIADLSSTGTSVVYISHRLGDVLDVADTVTVMRDGQVVATGPADALTASELMLQMTGQAPVESAQSIRRLQADSCVLEIKGITSSELPHPVSFDCRAGEIVGIAGLAGSGRSEVLNAVFGLTPLRGGRVSRITGSDQTDISDACQAVKNGMGYLGEDRQAMGLFSGQSVLTNIMLPGRGGARLISLIDRKAEKSMGAELAGKLAIKCESLQQDIHELSGGNQQKALIARWLNSDVDIFLLDEPTRGVDVGTKEAINALLIELRDRSKTILVASSEIDELMKICDRILVLSSRKLVSTFVPGEWSEQAILEAAFSEFTSDSRSESVGPSINRAAKS